MNSMTGFGRFSVCSDGRELTIELKSVNHRFLDIAFRMPRSFSFAEDTIRKILSRRFSRGHIDVFCTYRNLRNDARTVIIDAALLNSYLSAARAASAECDIEDNLMLSDILRLPDVTQIVELDDDREVLINMITEALNGACDEMLLMRKNEGMNLCRDLLSRLDTISSIRESILEQSPIVVKNYWNNLQTRIEALLNEIEVDQARLATELAVFADKANIDEELVRLNSHICTAKMLLNSDEAIGRKLEFVVQEMNREFNTIGSKANDETIGTFVIAAKAELEKVREQIQNLE